MKFKTAFFSVVFIVAIGGGGAYGLNWWKLHQHLEITDNAYIRGHVTVISALVTGEIEYVHVLNNDYVDAGDPLVSFKPAGYEAAVDAERAKLRAAEADVEIGRAAIDNLHARRQLQRSLIAQSDARLAAIEAQASNAERELTRYQELYARKIGTRQKYERVMTDQEMLVAAVRRADAELAAAKDEIPVIDSEIRRMESNLIRLQAEVSRARASVNRSELALSDTIVFAPQDGAISNRKVEPGMYLEAGWPMMSLVPLQETWVIANFKETQLENVRPGQPALIEIDAYPNHPVTGRVDSVAPASAALFSLLPPQNTTGNFIKVVQRIPVRILYNLPSTLQGRVVPGMSVVITVDTSDYGENPTLVAKQINPESAR
ncbi:MAG TPA: HlyD family secretion protein [Alphaproteobacteria bacterium]|nr:HlyD family secretion protein [Alphaproteobacteria bacterium]